MLSKNSSKQWMMIREKRMLSLFREVAKRVPAYKDFLKKNKVNAASVRTLKDFELLPTTDKVNYLRQYALKDLCWDGTLEKPLVFAATSGSTGKPFYFPRSGSLADEYSFLVEMFIENNSSKKPTLVVICLGMGVWVGGLITFQAFERASERGKNLSILTPGLNKAEIFHALSELAPNFSQTILVGYPPFVKDVLDEAKLRGIKLSKLNLRLLFAAESFTENFRDRICEIAGIRNSYRDTLNIYGTADIGAMAFETPTAILIRRLAGRDQKLFSALFGSIFKTPTLAQYNPLFTNLEASAHQILLTGNSALPLVRYAVGDTGGAFPFSDAVCTLREHGIDLASKATQQHVHLYEFPFVYVYERLDFSVKLSGAIVYPEPVREALQESVFRRSVTGRFTMQTLRDRKQDPYLEINIELKHGVKTSQHLMESLQAHIVRFLLEKNSEYKAIYDSMRHRAVPRVRLWPHESENYFKPGVKQRWVIQQPV